MVSKIGNEFFIKPSDDGSSIDIFKISNINDFKNAIEKCSNPNREFVFEKSVAGKEITSAGCTV